MVVTDQLRAGLDDAARFRFAPDPAADSITRLEYRHVTLRHQHVARHQSAETRADDRHFRTRFWRCWCGLTRERGFHPDRSGADFRADHRLSARSDDFLAVTAMQAGKQRAHVVTPSK